MEEVANKDFVIEHRPDGIIVYRLYSMKREAADQWFAAHRQHSQEAYTSGQHLQRILDIREAGFPTPYVLSKVVEVVKSDPDDLHESYVVLVSDSAAFQLVSMTLSRLRRWVPNTRMFSDEQQALAWLEQRLSR